MSSSRDSNESGIMVYPRLPVPPPPTPGSRKRDAMPEGRRPRGGGKLIALAVVAAIAGGAGVWFVRPIVAPDGRIARAVKRADDAEAAATAQKARADALEKALDAASKGKRDAEAKLAVAETAQTELAGKTSTEATQRKTAEAIQTKLKATGAGPVTIQAGEVHLQIASAALFKPNDDALTDRGKAVLNRVAAALKDLPDKLVWIEGHTDDQPIALPRPPPAPPAVPPKKGAKPVIVAAPAPVVRFPTNWELSAARALAVVHHFQDVARLDPSRLAALAFGQYAPTSKKDKSANRRLEIVVAAKRAAN